MRQVQVILREAVVNLGEVGDVVGVKVGYARNYLLPQGKALMATDEKVNQLAHDQRVIADRAAKELKDLKALKDRLQQLKLEVKAKVGEEGKLFGSVTTANIAALIAEKGFKIDRRKILVDPIKEAGDHVIEIRLHRDLSAKVSLKVSDQD
jgi:large subunit ribosomal protein L9